MTDLSDATLDELRLALAPRIAANAGFDGWSDDALGAAADAAGIDHDVARLGWRTVDLIWRRAGDTATDLNHYSKRAILLGVYGATVTVFLDDGSEGFADSRAFLQRRIDGILRFETFKAGMTKRARYRPSLSRFVGRLRYPER